MSDNILVALRIRPLIFRELNNDIPKYWEAHENCIVQIDPSSKKPINSFTFDKVYDETISNGNIYKDLAFPIVQSALSGFNGTIFAYGQTSSGKTYTMTGNASSLGIIPLSIENIFNSIEDMPDREFLLRASYMEIYQENIYDLQTGAKITTLREDAQGQVLVPGLKEECVNSEEKLLSIMASGDKRRRVGETNMNERSSRSHSIFRLIIESRERGDKDCQGGVTVSHLNLVDLAGSENVSQTGAVGERLKEGGAINKSLFMLGRVISQLSEGEQYINFRDSRLTRILQNSLGGNAKTVIICTVTSASKEQTLSTVRFASRAKAITNKPIVNEVLSESALLKRYAIKIKQLKLALKNERNTDRAQEVEQVKEKLDEQEKRNCELRDKLRSLSEKFVVSSHSADSDKNKEMKKRRMTWAAPAAFRKPRMSLAIGRHIDLGENYASDASLSETQNTCCPTAAYSHEKSVLSNIAEEEGGGTHDTEQSIKNCSVVSFEAETDIEDQWNRNELSNLKMDDSFLSPKAITFRRRRKKVNFLEPLVRDFVDAECQTDKPVANIEPEQTLFTPPRRLSPFIGITPGEKTPRDVLRSMNRKLRETLETKDVVLNDWKNELIELEDFHKTELDTLFHSYQPEMELESEVTSLKQSLKDTEGLYLEANKKVHEQALEIKALKEHANILEKESKFLRKADNVSHMNEIQILKDELKEKKEKITQLENDKLDFDMKIDLALQQQKKNEAYLRQSLDDAWEEIALYEKGSITEVRERKSKNKNVERDLEKARDDLKTLKNEKEDLSKEFALLKQELDDTNEKSKEESEIGSKLSNEIKTLQEERDELKKSLFDLNAETQTMKENYNYINETTMYTCDEKSPLEQTCMMNLSAVTNPSEVSRKLSETIHYLDESLLGTSFHNKEFDLKEIKIIRDQLLALRDYLFMFENEQQEEALSHFVADNVLRNESKNTQFLDDVTDPETTFAKIVSQQSTSVFDYTFNTTKFEDPRIPPGNNVASLADELRMAEMDCTVVERESLCNDDSVLSKISVENSSDKCDMNASVILNQDDETRKEEMSIDSNLLDLQVKVQSQAQLIVNLENELAELKIRKEESSKELIEIKEKEEEVIKLRSKIKELEEEVNEIRNKLQEIEVMNQYKQMECKTEVTDWKMEEKNVDDKDVTLLSENCFNLEKEIASNIIENQKELKKETSLEEEVIVLHLRENELKNEVTNLSEKQKDLESEVGKLRDREIELKEEVTKLRTINKDFCELTEFQITLENEGTEIRGTEKELQKEVFELRNREKSLENKLSELGEIKMKLENELAEVNSEVIEFSKNAKEYSDELKEKLIDYEKEITELRRRETEFEKEISELRRIEIELESTIIEMKTKDDNLTESEEIETRLKTETTALKERKDELETEVSELKEREEHYKNELSELKEKQIKFEKKINDLRMKENIPLELKEHEIINKEKEWKKSEEEWENEVINLQTKEKKLLQVVTKLNDQQAKLTDELAKMKENEIKLVKEVNDLQTNKVIMEELKDREMKLESEVMDLKGKEEELEKICTELRKNEEELLIEVSKLRENEIELQQQIISFSEFRESEISESQVQDIQMKKDLILRIDNENLIEHQRKKEEELERELSDTKVKEMDLQNIIIKLKEREKKLEIELVHFREMEVKLNMDELKRKEIESVEDKPDQRMSTKQTAVINNEEELQHQVNEWKNLEEKLKSDLKESTEKMMVLEKEVAELREKEDDLESMITDFTWKEEQLDEKEAVLMKKETEFKECLEDKTQIIHELKLKITQLEKKLEGKESSSDNIDLPLMEREDFKNLSCEETDVLHTSVSQMNDSLTETNLAKTLTHDQINELIKEKNNLSKDLEALREIISSYDLEVKSFEDEKCVQENQLHCIKCKLNEKNLENEQLNLQLMSLNLEIVKIREIKTKYNDCCVNIKELVEKLPQKEKTNNVVENWISEGSGSIQVISNANSEAKNTDKDVIKVCREIDEKQQYENKHSIKGFDKLDFILNDFNISDLEDIKNELERAASLSNTLDERNDECKALKSEVANLQINLAKMTSFITEIEELKNTNHRQNIEKTKLFEEIKDKIMLCEEKEVEIKSLVENIQQLEEEKEEKVSENNLLKEKIQRINIVLDNFGISNEECLENELKKFSTLENELIETRKECSSLKSEFVFMQTDYEKVKIEINQLNKLKEMALQDVEKHVKTCKEYENQILVLTDNIERLEKHNESNIAQYNVLEDKVRLLDNILESFHISDVEGIKIELKKIAMLSEELNHINIQCKSLISENETLQIKCGRMQSLSNEIDELKDINLKKTEEKEKLDNELIEKCKVNENLVIVLNENIKCLEDEKKFALDKLGRINEILRQYNFNDLDGMLKELENAVVLSNELDQMKKECDALKSDIDVLMADQAILLETVQESQNSLQEHIEVLHEKDNVMKSLECDLESARKVHEECTEKGVKHTMEVENYISIIEKYEFELSEKEKNNQKLNLENIDLKLEVQTLKYAENKEHDIENRLKSSEIAYKNLEAHFETVKKNCEILNEKNQRLVEKLQKFSELEDGLFRLKNEKAVVEERLSKSEEELKEKCSSYNALSEEYDGAIELYTTQINDLRSSVKKHMSTIQSLKHENGTLSESIKSLSLCEQMDGTNISLKNTTFVSSNSNNSEQIMNLRKNLDQLKSENCKLIQTINKIKEQNDLLNEKLKDTQTRLNTVQNSSLASNPPSVTNKSSSLQLTKRKMMEKIDDLESRVFDLENEIDLLRRRDGIVGSNEELEKQLQWMRKEMNKTEQLNKTLNMNYDYMEKELAELEEKNKKLEEKVAAFESSKANQTQAGNSKDPLETSSLKEQYFELKRENNVLKLQVEKLKAPIQNDVKRWKDELKMEQEKNRRLMAELRRVQNENICDASMFAINPSAKKPEHIFKNEPVCGYGSKIVLDVQVMELKNENHHLEKERKRLESESKVLKEHVQHYKRKAEEWKTKCYKEEQKIKKFTEMKTSDESKTKEGKDQDILRVTKLDYKIPDSKETKICQAESETKTSSSQSTEESADSRINVCSSTRNRQSTTKVVTSSLSTETRGTSLGSYNTLSRNVTGAPPPLAVKQEKAAGKENVYLTKQEETESEECKVQ